VALTRADGVLYFAAFPGLLIASRLLSREERLGRADGAQLLVYAALFGALYGGYLLFRVLYFGDLYPNVYYSKGGPTLSSVVAMVTLRFRMVAKLGHLVACFGGTLGAVVLGVALLLINFRLVVTRQFNRVHGVLTVFMATAAVIYLLMPVDWMGGYRFAIPFFPFFLVYAATVLTEFLRGLAIDHRVRVGTQALMVGWVVVWSGFAFTSHSRLFRRAPVAPFARVMADAERFNGYAARLGLTGASVALADLGGNLYYSSLRVVDLAGLCDKTIARTLRKDTAAFHDYLFDEVKPTFIHLAGPWVHIAVLDSDERFRRDYVAIRELVSGGSESSGEPVLRLGDYVRRDAVFDQAEELARMQAEGRVPPVVKLTGRRSRWGELRAR